MSAAARISSKRHQTAEDGKRTPPRRPTRTARPAKIITFTSHGSDSAERRRQFSRDLFDAGKSSLFYTLTAKNDRTRPKTAVLNIVSLQRMNIHGLQKDLAECAAKSFADGEFDRFPLTMQDKLNRYCKCFASHGSATTF